MCPSLPVFASEEVQQRVYNGFASMTGSNSGPWARNPLDLSLTAAAPVLAEPISSSHELSEAQGDESSGARGDGGLFELGGLREILGE